MSYSFASNELEKSDDNGLKNSSGSWNITTLSVIFLFRPVTFSSILSHNAIDYCVKRYVSFCVKPKHRACVVLDSWRPLEGWERVACAKDSTEWHDEGRSTTASASLICHTVLQFVLGACPQKWVSLRNVYSEYYYGYQTSANALFIVFFLLFFLSNGENIVIALTVITQRLLFQASIPTFVGMAINKRR